MKNMLKTGVALAVLMVASPVIAMADNAVTTTIAADGNVDAGALIGKDVVDGKGETIGEIDGVMVDAKGKVQSVIIDVSGWLQTEKLVPVAWKELRQTEDGKVVSKLTKESAESTPPYDYADDSQRGKIMTGDGKPYAADQSGSLMPSASPIRNADGTLNSSKLIGLNVENTDGDNLGEVGEVVLQEDGNVQGVVVDVGGFLGMGTHSVLLNWKDVKLSGTQDDVKATVNASKDRLKGLPAYEANAR
ncbi:MAG: PRC-barrel domain-containing protein [Rhodospirillaceae bacterium]|nr:PRC-barrel domain-containing protein [Rhodospirillaceae bacterium]